ncbi:MAG: hypothetical protein ABI696_04010 [Rubrivivax sp.]
MRSNLPVRLVTLLLWAAVAASAVFWGLRLFAPSSAVPSNAQSVAAAGAPRGDPTRVLGAAPAASAVAEVVAPSRYRLVGVVAPRASAAAGQGLAVIQIDDKPARAYRVGATVDDRLVLQRVHARGADLVAQGETSGQAAQQSAVVALTLAPLAPAATGRPGGFGGPAATPAARPFSGRPLIGVPGLPVVPSPSGLPPPSEPEDSSEPPDQGSLQPLPPGSPMRPGIETQ